MRVSPLLQNGFLCSCNSIHFKRWRVYTQLRLPSSVVFLFYLYATPETNCSTLLLHFGVCLFVTNGYHSIPPPFLSLSNQHWLFAPLEFFFLCFLCCNQTWWFSFCAPLGYPVSKGPLNKCGWLERGILLLSKRESSCIKQLFHCG